MKKVLITGGAGFIGSHLTERCIQEGYITHVIDDFSTGSMINLLDVLPVIKILGNRDITDPKIYEELDQDYDVIFHVAARASIPDSIKDPIASNNQNVGGILRVLEFAKKIGAIVIFSSSSSIYGDTEIMPTSETNIPNPISPYAVQKLIGEQYMNLYQKIYGLKGAALRYFNVYGERQPGIGSYALVLGKFLQQKKDNKPFTIFGSGEQRRDFIYVGDVVEANILAAQWAKTSCKFEVFNVGSGINYSVHNIAAMIDENRPKEYLPPRIEPFANLADITKIKSILNWQPKTQLKEWTQKQV